MSDTADSIEIPSKTEIRRLRRHVIVVADEAEAVKLEKRGRRIVPKGIDLLAVLTPADVIATRGLPLDSFELTDAAKEADGAADAKALLESDEARTAAGTI